MLETATTTPLKVPHSGKLYNCMNGFQFGSATMEMLSDAVSPWTSPAFGKHCAFLWLTFDNLPWIGRTQQLESEC